MTQSLEDYLERIHILLEEQGRARIRDVAEGLCVTMPSVNRAVAELKKLGLVEQQPYGTLKLTAEGMELSDQIHERHNLLRRFLCKLGVSEEVAERDACRMEHILSAETFAKIRQFTRGKRG